jgi:hypothetical protein
MAASAKRGGPVSGFQAIGVLYNLRVALTEAAFDMVASTQAATIGMVI